MEKVSTRETSAGGEYAGPRLAEFSEQEAYGELTLDGMGVSFRGTPAMSGCPFGFQLEHQKEGSLKKTHPCVAPCSQSSEGNSEQPLAYESEWDGLCGHLDGDFSPFQLLKNIPALINRT